ncbi:hypothetical protein [Adhaeribacter radiodurans]|uniref:Uncharacterized protein n=1 Tax=Adhaeribacter radiodurans TaxID=2745197 RepID=A0A7L7L244_9BACT|nr:hypothetical protein [Adhaeribacter radiodurans]QMU26861.1 hypothetical protein HUW48_01895 [Adhaeribacter radiodurans]
MAGRPRLALSGGLANLGSLRCAMPPTSAPERYKALHSQTGVFVFSYCFSSPLVQFRKRKMILMGGY